MTALVPHPTLFELADCRHGRMLFLPGDVYVGGSLALHGKYSAFEVQLFRSLILPGDTVLDIGANLGARPSPWPG